MTEIRVTPRPLLRLCLVAGLLLPWGASHAEEAPPRYRVEQVWQHAGLIHQHAASDACVHDGFVYIGGGGAKSRITKVRLRDGDIAWSVEGSSYQPSYPVSDGEVVCLGRYYEGAFAALDDATGAERWVSFVSAMGSACFTGDLACFGGYHRNCRFLYAVERKTGAVRWKAPVGEKIWSTPVVWKGLVIVGCYDGFLYAFEEEAGKRAWRVDCKGRVASNPVLAGDLAFLQVDDQRVEDKYDNQKVRRRLLVVDLESQEVIHCFRSPVRWSRTVVVDGGQVFFHDHMDFELHAYDVSQRKLLYKIKAPSAVLPWPLLTRDHLVFGLRPAPRDCMPRPVPLSPPPCAVAVHDRRTGERLALFEDGGAVLSRSHGMDVHRRVGDLLLVVGRGVSAWRLTTAP